MFCGLRRMKGRPLVDDRAVCTPMTAATCFLPAPCISHKMFVCALSRMCSLIQQRCLRSQLGWVPWQVAELPTAAGE